MTENQTSAFLGPPYAWSQTQMELDDRQPFFGGIKIYLHSWTNGPAYVTRVAPGNKETKYKILLGRGEKEQLCRLFVEQDFLTIELEDRPGIPDEARPSITLTNRAGEKHTVSKWAGVKDARFDAVYAALGQIAERTKGEKPIATQLRPYQKALFILGLILALLAGWLLANRAASAVTVMGWPAFPGRLVGLAALLIAGLLPALLGLRWQERRKARYERMGANVVFLGLLNLLFLLGLVTLPSFLWRSALLLWGETAVAPIHSLSPTFGVIEDGGWWQQYQVTYAFQPEPGRSFTRQHSVSQDYFATLQPGGEIEVAYLPILPRFSLPASNLASGEYATLLLTTIFTLYLLISGAALAGPAIQEFVDERF